MLSPLTEQLLEPLELHRVGGRRRRGEVRGDRDQSTGSRAGQQTSHRAPNEIRCLFDGLLDMLRFHEVVGVVSGDSVAGSTRLKQCLDFYSHIFDEPLTGRPGSHLILALVPKRIVSLQRCQTTHTLQSFPLGQGAVAVDGVEQVGGLLAVAGCLRSKFSSVIMR